VLETENVGEKRGPIADALARRHPETCGGWMQIAQERETWKRMEETYVQEWTATS